jgi:uncharacterized protein YjiS (DUF1127 family)
MNTLPLDTTLARSPGLGLGARTTRSLVYGLRQAAAALREWQRRRRDRAVLATLDDRMLRDIGVSRCEILAEIDKPFWRR